MAFELCLALGVPHPDHLFQMLTWDQFQDWLVYYDQAPFGEHRADLRQAVLINYMLPTEDGSDLPNVIYPYFNSGDDEIDFEAHAARIQDHKRKHGL